MTAVELLRQLERHRVTLWVGPDGRLHYRAPAGVLDEALRTMIAAQRDALITLLAATAAGPPATAPTASPAAAASALGEDASSEETLASALNRFRTMLSPGLRRWSNDRLQALIAWHVAVAFARGGAADFRRSLPPSIAILTDAELDVVVDWADLATLEKTLWPRDRDAAALVSRGARAFATWQDTQRQRAAAAQRAAHKRVRR